MLDKRATQTAALRAITKACGGVRDECVNGGTAVRLRVRFWAVLVPLHVTSTSPVPLPYSYTHTKLKPARLHEPPFTTTPSTVCGGSHVVTLIKD